VDVTPNEAQRLISFGAVYLDRQRVRSNQPVFSGQYIRVHIQPKRFPVAGINWHSRIVVHNGDFVVVNKPSGVPVHATVDNACENVLYQLSDFLGTPLYITQRLDTEVSGLLVLAKTKAFQREFNGLLVERKVKKRYRALVTAAPALGRYVHYLESSKRSPKAVHTTEGPNSQRCALTVLNVRPIRTVSQFDVEIDLETGRTHQIRAQLSAMGSPIVGDALYGSSSSYETGIALFSAATSWAEYEFTAKPPWVNACEVIPARP
jgi:23S rRNA pseudouridine1911/1915/1917 synthase